MESQEERLHKQAMRDKINETKEVMKQRANEIDKNKLDKNRGDKGGFMSMSGPKSFTDLSISSSGSGFGNGSTGFGGSAADAESFSSKS